MQMDIPYDAEVLILGGGAAGLMCAYRLGELGIQAIVLEKIAKLGGRSLFLEGDDVTSRTVKLASKTFAHTTRITLGLHWPATPVGTLSTW